MRRGKPTTGKEGGNNTAIIGAVVALVVFCAGAYFFYAGKGSFTQGADVARVVPAKEWKAERSSEMRLAVVAIAPENIAFNSREVTALLTAVPKWKQGLNAEALEVVIVFPSLSPIAPGFKALDTPGPITFKIIQPCKDNPSVSSCAPKVAYTDLVNYGMHHVSAGISHIFFWSLTLVATPPLLPDLEKHLLPEKMVGGVGCTITNRVNKTNGMELIVEHGLIMGNGWVGDDWLPHLLRQFHGFNAIDARVKGVTEVLAVSPFCMLTYRPLVDSIGGFRKFAPAIQEQIELGQVPRDFLASQARYLKKKIVLMGTYTVLKPISQDEPIKMKRARREAIITATEALSLLELIEGKSFDDRELVKVEEPELQADKVKKITPDVYCNALNALTSEMKSAIKKMKEMQLVNGVAGRQEEGGWDFCIRIRKRGMSIIATNYTAEQPLVEIPALMKPLHAFEAGDFTEISPASLVVNGAFAALWLRGMREYWPGEKTYHTSWAPSTNNPTKPTYRVIWQSFCCHCCGFANEILHLVFPLQFKHAIDLVPAPDCFCQGYPTAVLDSLSRMHIPERVLDTPVRYDEIVVWVSHTDPGSYLTNPLVKKRPNYVVGRSMYEFTKIPPRWVNECRDNADEIWVPSIFVKDVWLDNGIAPEKVVLIPESVDVFFFDPDVAGKLEIPFSNDFLFYDSRSERPVKQVEKEYKFLSHFKWEDRKGWDVLYEAYFSSFTPEDDVVLIVLTHIWFPGPPETHGDPTNHTLIREIVHKLAKDRLNKKPEELPHFIVLTSRMPEEDVAALYNSVDGFILPTRGEGWGLPPLQAMSMGVPTATTNWSGTVDFLNPEVSFPIRIDGIAEIPKDSYYGYVEGKKWALPSLEDTKRIMKIMQAPSNREKMLDLGRRARAYVVENFSEEVIAEIVSKRIEDIKQIIINNRVQPRTPHWY